MNPHLKEVSKVFLLRVCSSDITTTIRHMLLIISYTFVRALRMHIDGKLLQKRGFEYNIR